MKTQLVTELKRHATKIIGAAQRSKQPVLITQHGRAAAYLVDAESYEAMALRTELLEGIARGERAIEEGRTVSQAQARTQMKRWLK